MNVDTHIEMIAKALAERGARGGGRATAIVGAGFSRNAERRAESAKSFPLWRDIVRPLIDELLPPCRGCSVSGECPDARPRDCHSWERRRNLFRDSAGASGMMMLGDKFEAQKGRARLRAALASAVPDEYFRPGTAHQLLVRLPWADIFTTNWDSLIERAVDDYDRSYDTVVTVEQIASTSSPRIVKLHGCLRSGTRLIFTEEDYRTYPKLYAPFVSLVQQSFMQNVVVLYGFSGADPNFRAWHGWLRDHLGRNIQPLYLVNLRPTDPIDTNLMAGRLINYIDLSQVWGDLNDQAKIERFLQEIHRKLRRFRPNLDWPNDWRSDAVDPFPTGNTLRGWRERLDAYPNWVVAPAENRFVLLRRLEAAIDLVFDDEVPYDGALDAMKFDDEGRETGLGFKDDDEKEKRRKETAVTIAEALRIGLARPGGRLWEALCKWLLSVMAAAKLPTERFDLRPDHEIFGDVAGTEADAPRRVELVTQLLPLVEVMEREARLRGETGLAGALRDALWRHGGDVGRELAVRGALNSALGRLNLAEIAALLELLPQRRNDDVGNLRRAAVFAELRWIKTSLEEIVAVAGHLRTLGSSRRRETAESSREAWAYWRYLHLVTVHFQTVTQYVGRWRGELDASEVKRELQERLDELDANRYDPRDEIDTLVRNLEVAVEHDRLLGLVEKQGRAHATQPGVVGDDPATVFLLLCETVGVPVDLTHRGVSVALAAATLLAGPLRAGETEADREARRGLAKSLVLRAGTPSDLPFAGASATREVVDLVFDPNHAGPDLESLVGSLRGLLVLPTRTGPDLLQRAYLDQKVALLQHLIGGILRRSAETVGPETLNVVVEGACETAESPVVAAHAAGQWTRQDLFLAVFEAIEKETTFPVLPFLARILEFPQPSAAEKSELAGWPDPFALLVTVPQRKFRETGAPVVEMLRKLGVLIVERARRELVACPTLRAGFESRRDRHRLVDEGSEAAVIAARRRVFLDALLEVVEMSPGDDGVEG